MARYQPPSHLPNPNDPRNWPDPRIVAMEKDGLRTFGQTVNNNSIFNQDPRLTEMEQNRQRTLLQGTKYPISPSQFGEDYSVNTIQKFYPGKVRVVRKTLEHYYKTELIRSTNKDKKCDSCEEVDNLDFYITIPLKINVIKGTNVTDEVIENGIKIANEIFGQAAIYFWYDKNLCLTRDFEVPNKLDGIQNGKLTATDMHKLQEVAISEIRDWVLPQNTFDIAPDIDKKEEIKGKGIKIYYADYISEPGKDWQDDTTYPGGGLAGWGGKEHCVFIAPIGGVTLAHEIGHMLISKSHFGPGSGEKTENEGKNSDWMFNLMASGLDRKPRPKDYKGPPQDLTMEQIKEARKNALAPDAFGLKKGIKGMKRI